MQINISLHKKIDIKKNITASVCFFNYSLSRHKMKNKIRDYKTLNELLPPARDRSGSLAMLSRWVKPAAKGDQQEPLCRRAKPRRNEPTKANSPWAARKK